MGAYCTQIDPYGSGRERCGGACLASVMLSEGWQSDPWELTCQVSDQCGISDRGCTSQELLACAARQGFTGGLWYVMDEANAHLQQGHAVLPLHDNSYLEPRAYPPGGGWNAHHWIRLVRDIPPDNLMYVYDPLTYLAQPDGSIYQGPTVYVTDTIIAAIQATPYPEAGIYLVSPSGKNLNA